MTKHLKFSYLPIAFLAVAVSLSACGGGGGGGTPPGGDGGAPVVDPDPMPEPTASTEQERFDARLARNNAIAAKEAAEMAVPGAVEAANTAMGKAAEYAGNASDSADQAMAARTDYATASENSSGLAGEQQHSGHDGEG